MASSAVLWSCQSRKSGADTGPSLLFSQRLAKVTMRSGSLNERGLSSTAFTTLNVAALAPMPKAITNRATKVNPRFFLSMRAAKRRSCQDVPKTDSQAAERTTSLLSSRLPRSRRTARTASLRLTPCFIFSSAAISKKSRSSSSHSPSTRSFRNSDRNPSDRLRSSDMVRLRRLQDSGDRRHLPSPFSCFAVEPLSSLFCNGVILGTPAILGGLPVTSDQARSLQPLKGDK